MLDRSFGLVQFGLRIGSWQLGLGGGLGEGRLGWKGLDDDWARNWTFGLGSSDKRTKIKINV